MKRNIVVAAIVASLFGLTIAQETGMGKWNQDPAQTQMQELTWEGYLVDSRTASDIGNDPLNAEKKAAEYPKANAVSLGVANGFSLLVGNEWFKLDATGNGRAQAIVRDSNKETGIRVIVIGRRYGDTIAVTSIEEVVEKSDKPKY
ncbi:MAG: hypothetical protein AB1728_04235 [Bacteroidota bacterium]